MYDDFGLSALIGFYGNVLGLVLFGTITTTMAQSIADRATSAKLWRKRRGR